jgi:alkylation response protein AidB-like acyl-CoA dehydrogenase
MTEPTPLAKAEAAVREAQTDTVAVQLALAAVELAKAATAQPQAAPAPACGHQHKLGRSAGEWIGIACAVCVGGVGIAFASLALAILGGVAAIVALILRDLWRDMQKKR